MPASKTQVVNQLSLLYLDNSLTRGQKAAAKDGGEKTEATGGGQQVL